MVSIAIDLFKFNLSIFEVHNNCSTSNKRTKVKVGNEIIKLALKVT